jgi:hypothetical protein
MTIRTRNSLVVFHHPFELKGVDRTLPAGEYRVMTDEQLIEELSFPVYHRVSTVIFAPGQSPNSTSVEMVTIDPRDLQAAQDRDNARGASNLTALARSRPVSLVGAFSHPQGIRPGICSDDGEDDRSRSAPRDGCAEGHRLRQLPADREANKEALPFGRVNWKLTWL